MGTKTPPQIKDAIEKAGESKANLSFTQMSILGILAGIFIGFGAILSSTVSHDLVGYVGVGVTKFASGAAFTVGLMLVVVCGAELFTSNNLISIAFFEKRISFLKLGKNWVVVYLFNFVGSLFLVLIYFGTGLWHMGSDPNSLGIAMVTTASQKVALDPISAFSRGILCNMLVCLAIWFAAASTDTIGKIFAVFFPIMAFVTSGFEHSIANMFFIPIGILVHDFGGVGASVIGVDNLNWGSFLINNLLPVTIGNIVGGVVFIAFLYWMVYKKKEETIAELRPTASRNAKPNI